MNRARCRAYYPLLPSTVFDAGVAESKTNVLAEVNTLRESKTVRAPRPQAPAVSPSRAHVYDLRRGNNCSDSFYAALPAFADQIVSDIEHRAAPLLDGYSSHVERALGEAPRSRGEYALEFLALGMLLARYEGAAQHASRWILELARKLTWVREHSPKIKPVADWARAGIARYSLAPVIGRKAGKRGSAVERLTRLIDWMKSTGEFKQEAQRLDNWHSYLVELRSDKATYWLRVAVELFHDFESNADTALGSYTRGVSDYVAREHARLRWREDLLMCGKPAVEYQLNMVAAEVMNRGLCDSFRDTSERVVLLPACMRGDRSSMCKARINGVDMTCAGCDPNCAINRITRGMSAHGIRVYIVPHSGGFSRWLARWQHVGVGVTAVACALNIVPGGLEMRERGIAAQCLPLDFPGCRKHWDSMGFPTAVNEKRLVQIATAHADPVLIGQDGV
jgi:hypothetical protein